MSTCSRCGAEFGCAMADGGDGPCWCTELPPVLPVPGVNARCWCPACLKAYIEQQKTVIPAKAGIPGLEA